RQRAELLARVAAAVVDQLGPAEARAGLDVDDRADLHRTADRDVAAPSRQFDLQLARLAWVQPAVMRRPGRHPDPFAHAGATTVGALIKLIEARQGDDTAPPDPEPLLADALLMIRDAADHLTEVLRVEPSIARRWTRSQSFRGFDHV